MKKIYKNSDIKFNVDSDKRIGNKFLIKFYTTNKNFYITHNSDEVIVENETRYIKLNWSELSTIGDGVLNYVCNVMDEDKEFDDGVYNDTFSRTTNYYIASYLNVDEEDAESYSQMLADLKKQANEIEVALEAEVERATTTDDDLQEQINELKTNHEADIDVLNNAIQQEATDRENAIQAERQFTIDGLNTLSTETTTAIEAEKTRATNKEKELSEAIDTLQTKVNEDIAKALEEEKERAEKADADLKKLIEDETSRATGKETELSNNIDTLSTNKANKSDVYTKTETNNLLNAKVDKTTYATDKAAIESDIDTLQTSVADIEADIDKNEKVTSEAINDLRDIIKDNEKVVSVALQKLDDGKADKADVTALATEWTEKEQTISASLTNLNNNKANKSDVYTKAESDAKYITEHQDISNLATKTELAKKANSSDVYTKAQTDNLLKAKQATLTAGTGIEITNQNVIKIEDNLVIDCGDY